MELAANKRDTYDMWRAMVDARNMEVAKQYIDEIYIQHNPIADTGWDGLVEYFESLGEPLEIPERMIRPLVAVLAEGDLVAMAWMSLYPAGNNNSSTTGCTSSANRLAEIKTPS